MGLHGTGKSIHGLLSGSSYQKEAPADDDDPTSDPYMQPRGSSHQGEAPRGSSQQREEPQRDTSAQERRWEDHRSSPGSPEEEHGAEEHGAEEHGISEPYFEKEDEVMEEAMKLWVEEDLEEDEMITHVTCSASATNLCFFV